MSSPVRSWAWAGGVAMMASVMVRASAASSVESAVVVLLCIPGGVVPVFMAGLRFRVGWDSGLLWRRQR